MCLMSHWNERLEGSAIGHMMAEGEVFLACEIGTVCAFLQALAECRDQRLRKGPESYKRASCTGEHTKLQV